ncbi:hypothetical protein PoMZ_08714 [Pyricularia oryzae]|uniref:Uncharacterized protein n=1 Tax=Pyricularia oryzae TaxID=318829 RepID=A0A4P7NIB7_PYROR|nr:hypothetical protein PoMZ_08714 [Pyricularia oryzae]
MQFSFALVISIFAHVAMGTALGANINNDPGFVCKPGNVPYTCLKGNLVPRELTVGTFLIACAGYIAVFLLQACSESMLSDSDPTTRAVRHIRNEIAYDRFDRSVMNWLRS